MQRLIEIPDTGLVGVIIERLADAGIDATVTHEHAVWGHYIGGPRPAIIWIADEAHLDRANEIVAEILPAAGHAVRASEPGPPAMPPDRPCPHCQETIPGDFELCWNCGQPVTS